MNCVDTIRDEPRNGLLSVVRQVRDLVRSWWTVDRIRVPVSEGELLAISPPALVRILDRHVVIDHRSVRRTADDVAIEYVFTDDDETGRLVVRPSSLGEAPTVTWYRGDRDGVNLDASDVRPLS